MLKSLCEIYLRKTCLHTEKIETCLYHKKYQPRFLTSLHATLNQSLIKKSFAMTWLNLSPNLKFIPRTCNQKYFTIAIWAVTASNEKSKYQLAYRSITDYIQNFDILTKSIINLFNAMWIIRTLFIMFHIFCRVILLQFFSEKIVTDIVV